MDIVVLALGLLFISFMLSGLIALAVIMFLTSRTRKLNRELSELSKELYK